MALLDAATDIEACAEALFEQAHNVAFEGEITAGAIIRTYASRIKAMNSLVISYVGPDAITLDDAFAAIHGPVLGIELLTRQLDHARVSVPAETVPAEVRATDGDYMAGVRLARALVVKGNLMSRAKPLDESFNLMSCYREDPDGTENPQNNWALSAVRSLIGNPAMAEGFAAVLSDAFACYDVDLPMYRAEDLTLAKIKGSISASAASAPSPEQDFMEGLRLAVDIVKAGKELAGSDADRCELSAKYRGGAQQDNFALPFIGQLVQLAEFPALLEGFSAVMSNIFAAQIVPGPDELNALTYFDIHRPLTAEQAAELVEEESKALDAAHAARTATPKASKAAKAPKKTSIKSGSKALAA
ncbi:MAG: hypothetical protein B7X88_22655 [Polaromonas sp. 17-63-33]|nr:MAG: hypothetical protein B7Y09_09385 [Polaromonas sp. 24-63-21]OZA47304.1 MAG: hypothetical protein B7X88_22655 [Polaromonas sp. 17-63-33]